MVATPQSNGKSKTMLDPRIIPEDKILAQVDKATMIGMRIIISIFVALFVVLAFFFGLTLTAFLIFCRLFKFILIFILSRKETKQVFGMIGGNI